MLDWFGRLLSRLGGAVVPAGVAIWAVGVVYLIQGDYWAGGALIFTGGFLLIVWAGGGFRRFRMALGEWLDGP